MSALKGAKILSFASIFNNPLFDNKALVSVFSKAKEEADDEEAFVTEE